MIANRKLSILIALGCYALLFLWLYYWIFLDLRGSKHHYRDSLPLAVLGVYGSIVGGLGAIIVRRKSPDLRLLSVLAFSPGFTLLSTVIICGVLLFNTPSNSDPILALVFIYGPGVGIFGGIPTALSGYATACLFSAGHTPPID